MLDRERFYYVLRGGPQVRLSERLTVSGNIGGTLTETSRDPLLPGPRLDETSFGTLADASFNYLLKTGSVTGAVSYGLTPDDNGDFQNSLNFSAAVSHTINDLTSVRLGGQYVLADSAINGSLSNTTLSISPSLSYTLARDWQMTASYQFVWQDNENGDAYQNAVYLTLSRNYVLVP